LGPRGNCDRGGSGIGSRSNPLADYSLGRWQKVIDVNLNSVFYYTRRRWKPTSIGPRLDTSPESTRLAGWERL